MGSLFKSKTSTTKSPFESNPWAAQQPYLTGGFQAGQTALDAALGYNAKIGDTVADLTGTQKGLMDSTILAGQGFGALGGAFANAGSAAAGQYGQYLDNAAAIFKGLGDPTQQIVGNAGQYINNDVLQGQIDSALGDVNRAFQGTVGEINSAASGVGGLNSTRAGVLESRALDDAQDRAASISAGMRGDAYNTGLGLAAQTYQDGVQNQLAANGALGQGVQAGFDLTSGGASLGLTGLQEALRSASMYQSQEQNEIDGGIAQNQNAMNLIQQYMQIVGGNYGSQGFQTQVSKSSSPFQQLVGGAAAIGGLMGG